jgi:hypothetical protein
LIRISLLLALALAGSASAAQDAGDPEALLVPAPTLEFPAETDSNSPAFWADERLHVFNSLHTPYLSEGRNVARLDDPMGVRFRGGQRGPRWMESVLQDEDGTLYGFYHLEPAGLCPANTKTAPAIGAARSTDGGLTWDDLGLIIVADAATRRCSTENLYFVGGEGDFSAILDRDRRFVYFFFSAYPSDLAGQGIAVARMSWSDRARPAGRVVKWRDGAWATPAFAGRATPFFPAAASWHEFLADAFWGPSVHWNTFLGKYVMLMTRAADAAWSNEGIYVSYADALDDPLAWSTPKKLLSGGAWYPQVMGLERGRGTDTLAGEYARFFMGGRSDHLIRFIAPAAADAAAAKTGARAPAAR